MEKERVEKPQSTTHPAEDQKGECRKKEGGEEGEKPTTTILWRKPFENKGEILSR